MMKRPQTLPEYIQNLGGDKPASILFGVSRQCISNWRRRTRYPRREDALMIIERTAGAVTWEGIYGAPREQQAA